MRYATLKHITISFLTAVILFISTAYMITRIFELNFYNELRITVEERLRQKDSFAESMLLSLSQISAAGNSSTINELSKPIFKKSQDLYKTAFISAINGTIITHSDPAEISRLNGNIGSDEFTYNLEEIYYVLTHQIDGIVKRDYHLLNEKVPFSDSVIQTLKTRVYSTIDKNGLIYTKKIRLKNRQLCAAAIIISKSDIYAHIRMSFESLSRLKLFIILSCFFLSTVVGTVIFVLLKKERAAKTVPLPESAIMEELPSSAVMPEEQPYTVYEAPYTRSNEVTPVIQDAIPIRRKRST